MLTPSKYWRVPCSLDASATEPQAEFILPSSIADQTAPPARGHGIVVAAYDEEAQTGLLKWLGVVTGGSGASRSVEWRPTNAEIWVDTAPGRGFWKAGAFAFAKTKISGYGLHELWRDHFEGMELADQAPMERRPAAERRPRPSSTARSRIAPERLQPIEVVGEPTAGVRAGVVYVLKSAYGYKVGRTRNVPARMRAFGVHLPIAYTIPICAWFDDCHHAEHRYHDMFASKRINGEWFDLTDEDVQTIRARA